MPGKPITRGRPLVYLDHSTLVDAFAGRETTAPADTRDLLRTVERIASTANLCLSLTHAWELAHYDHEARRRDRSRWIESLPVVWCHSDNEVIEREVINAVAGSARGTVIAPPLPAVPSFLSLFGEALTGEALAYALTHPSLEDFVEFIASEPKLLAGLEGIRRLSVDGARRLYTDHVAGLRAVDESTMRAELERRLRLNLEHDLRAAAARLRSNPHGEFFVMRSGILVPPSDEDVLSAVRGLPDLRTLPFVFLSQRVTQNMAFESARLRPSVTSRAFDQQRGDAYDNFHLVGAAYCDLFTCDTRTARWLAGGRELIGRAPAITAEGGIASLNLRLKDHLGY